MMVQLTRGVVIFLLILSSTYCSRHGSERIVVKGDKEKDDGMQFKQFSGNESEQMFTKSSADDLNLTMTETNITTSGYVSQTVKDQ